MPKAKTISYINVRDFPESLMNQIKQHLQKTGLANPSNNDAIHYACTQFVQQVLEADAASAA